MRKLAAGILLACGAAGAFAEDVADPLAAVNALFTAMTARDTGTIRALFAANAILTSVRADGSISSISASDWEQHVASGKGVWLERIWEPKTLQDSAMAVVWAPYDFHRDWKFSHCGIDSFNLVKIEGKWKIAGVVYTTRTEGCSPSPLGPPSAR